MGTGRIRRRPSPLKISCGTTERVGLAEVPPAAPDAPVRVVALRGGARWLVTVVARLVSEDMVAGVETARLVLRLECLTQPHRPVRVATVRARALDDVSDDALRALVATPAARERGRGR
jgi:hypothetical protein